MRIAGVSGLTACALLLLGCTASLSGSSASPAAGPAVFYSDVTGGPNSGGQNNAGALVTIYGKRFGATQGGSYVTVGGAKAAAYPVWSDSKVTFQLGAAASTGNIVLTTAAGASNGIPFTVRAGHLYFVSTAGSDSANGSFAAPWLTLLQARNTMQPGDITYAMNGVSQTTDDGTGWDSAFLLSSVNQGNWCSAGNPRAIVAYPGATVQIGPNGPSPSFGLRTSDCVGYYVFAGITFRGLNPVNPGTGNYYRFVGNDISCPNTSGEGACFETSQVSYVQFYGNNVHDAGTANASALFQGVYFSTDSSHIDMGWNIVANVHGCRGVQIHSSPLGSGGPTDPTGHDQFDISIHDNVIHDTQCDGIIVDTVDPSKGAVTIYNNVIYNAGKGPDNPEQSGGWSCINVPGSTENGPVASGIVDIYNNTLYSCGTFTGPPYGQENSGIDYNGGNPAMSVRIRNNIIYQTPTPLFSAGVPYVVIWNPTSGEPCVDSDNCSWMPGSNNLFYGSGAPPKNTNIVKSIGANPQFVNLALPDFHLQSNSPARGAGINAGAATDMDGVTRGGSEGYDIGAFQYVPPGAVAAITCAPAAIVAPGSATCDLILTAEAPAGGLSIPIESDNASLAVPAAVTIPAGDWDASFPVELPSGAAQGSATLSAVFAGAAASFVLWLFPLGTAAPVTLAIVNSASYSPGPVSPGELVTVFGLNLGPPSAAALRVSGGEVQTDLSNTTVMFGSTPAPLLYVQADQVSAVVPFEVAGESSVQVQVEAGGQISNPLVMPVDPTMPGLFTLNSSGTGQAVALNQDYSVNSPAQPAARNSIIALYATGLGQTQPPVATGEVPGGAQSTADTVSASIGGIDSQVLYAGTAPGFVAGVYQVNIQVPAGVTPGTAVPIVLASMGMSSQPGVSIAVE